jgi:hypothetical protein
MEAGVTSSELANTSEARHVGDARNAGIRREATGAINRRLVHQCDLLVGMFWTKIGTRSGVAESGTVEEIDQFVAAGKPALLCFSGRPIDPNKIDLKPHRKLQEGAHG